MQALSVFCAAPSTIHLTATAFGIVSFSTGYASSISSASDLAGNSWAAWAENGLLYAARWDSDAQRWGIRFTEFASAFMGNGDEIPLTWFKTMGWEFGLDGLFSDRTRTVDGDLKQTLDLDSSLNLTIGQLNRLGGKGDRNPLRLLKANNANELKPFDSRGPFSKAGQNFQALRWAAWCPPASTG